MLRKNINTVAMLTGDALLRHFRKGMYHSGDRRLHTLIAYVLLLIHVCTCCHLLFNIRVQCGCVVRYCSTPSEFIAAHITSAVFTVCKETDHDNERLG